MNRPIHHDLCRGRWRGFYLNLVTNNMSGNSGYDVFSSVCARSGLVVVIGVILFMA